MTDADAIQAVMLATQLMNETHGKPGSAWLKHPDGTVSHLSWGNSIKPIKLAPNG